MGVCFLVLVGIETQHPYFFSETYSFSVTMLQKNWEMKEKVTKW